MARDSDLSTVLDIISRRSRKAQTTVMDRFCNVLIICFGPRVSPLLFKGKAVEITSLVATFVAPSRVHVFFRLQAFPAFQLCCCFSLSHFLLLTLWPALTIKCMTTSFHARRKSTMQPSRRLYAESKNVLRLSQLLRSRSSWLNLRSLARSFLRLFLFSHILLYRKLELYLLLPRCQQFNRRLRKHCPRQVKHSHLLHLDPVERYRSRGLYARRLLENWDLLRNKLTLHLPLISGWREPSSPM